MKRHEWGNLEYVQIPAVVATFGPAGSVPLPLWKCSHCLATVMSTKQPLQESGTLKIYFDETLINVIHVLTDCDEELCRKVLKS